MLPLATLPLGNVFYAFQQSDWFARGIVVVLLVVSVHVWIVMLEKTMMIGAARRGSKRFLGMFEKTVSPLEMALQIDQFKGPVPHVYSVGVDEVMDVLEVDPELVETYCRRRTLPRPLSPSEIDKVRSTLERTVAAQIMMMESRMGAVGMAVTVCPFLGLLGTVWGVMMAFCGMAKHGRPDISAIAPGVSGALLTTVVGLIVAIPAVIGYNYIANSVRQTTVEMDNFVEDFLARLKLQTGRD